MGIPKSSRISYNYCGVCGRIPKDKTEPTNFGPIRWWDPDDGWKIGTLCESCYNEVGKDVPKPDDFAYELTNGVCDDENTDEDPSLAI